MSSATMLRSVVDRALERENEELKRACRAVAEDAEQAQRESAEKMAVERAAMSYTGACVRVRRMYACVLFWRTCVQGCASP